MPITANDPNRKSWLEVAIDSDFPIQNIPFGLVKTEDLSPFVATRIGDKVIDLRNLFQLGYLNNLGFVLADFGFNIGSHRL